mmetsp:Transcript_62068/g.134690  ORF Transcript_62068/g.134690 Transcript_62068/m.134690 type:complete len:468 (+) Transcript_62068:79-1482(+)|eukprot:CAMPEP_0170604090 /NCGR_PEP_ID=MMETSP0224-20130122/19243_1 /TAXON_ID=285029 /ORGANISM="Togula jolla, Strain CCCM 725" /LENGTH=467 /DNA_ID=CAMNT_0010928981 /DNA_START=77 /DNA_END=1480 /DNA_ORIENTATION=+
MKARGRLIDQLEARGLLKTASSSRDYPEESKGAVRSTSSSSRQKKDSASARSSGSKPGARKQPLRSCSGGGLPAEAPSLSAVAEEVDLLSDNELQAAGAALPKIVSPDQGASPSTADIAFATRTIHQLFAAIEDVRTSLQDEARGHTEELKSQLSSERQALQRPALEEQASSASIAVEQLRSQNRLLLEELQAFQRRGSDRDQLVRQLEARVKQAEGRCAEAERQAATARAEAQQLRAELLSARGAGALAAEWPAQLSPQKSPQPAKWPVELKRHPLHPAELQMAAVAAEGNCVQPAKWQRTATKGGVPGKLGRSPARLAPPVPTFIDDPKPAVLLRRIELPPRRAEDNYEISEPGDNSGDELMTSQEIEHQRSSKGVPQWCGTYLERLAEQVCIDPDTVFGSRVPECSLELVFPDRLYDAMEMVPPKRQRGSSGEWREDRLTRLEVRNYKQRMGQTKDWVPEPGMV